ncbi:MAG TPA: DUF4184 family protein [Steroidobacteraceae bacterium]|nr:DUF4184 family protein [Steroidobacteraceae bacterium]
MPFTVSHAAAVLPIHRLRPQLPLAALMIGSMSPDFLYFLPWQPNWLESHTLRGLFYFCWPAGLLAWLLFTRVLARPSQALLPDAWRGVFPLDDGRLTLRLLAIVSLALLFGAATHILWDSFTHRSSLSESLPVLGTPLFEIHGRTRRLWWLLQQLSTVIGLLILLAWAVRRRNAPRDARALEIPSVPHSTRVVAAGVIVVGTLALAAVNSYLHPYAHLERRVFHIAIGGMAGAALAWFAIALWINRRLAPPRE